jgi:dihydroneopterin aldolase
VTITVELEGLRLFGHHGALEEERRDGQPFLFDLRLDVPDSALSDRLEDAVDYRLVVDCVREVSEARAYTLLEALAHAVASELLERFPVERVRVRVRKPRVKLPVDWSGATVDLTRGEA